MRVTCQPIGVSRARGPKKLDLWGDADAGDTEVAVELPAGLGDDALDSLDTLEPIDAVAHYQLHSVRAMELGDHTPNLGPENTGQWHLPRIDGGHLESKRA